MSCEKVAFHKFNMELDESIQKEVENSVNSEYVTCGFSFNNKTCRICLLAGDIPIFNSDPLLDKSEHIKTLGDVVVCSEDNFPKYICQTCVKLLEAAVLFRTTAQQSDQQLRSRLNYYDDNECGALKLEPEILYEDTIGAEDIENAIIKEEIISETFLNESMPLIQEISLENYNNAIRNDNNQESQCTKNSAELLLVRNDYSCKTCNMNFPSSEAYSQHTKTAKHKNLRKSNKIECTVCSKKISDTFYNRHVEAHSNDNKDGKLQCPFCNKSYSKTYFNYHLTTHNEDHKKAPSERIECTICNKSYEKQYYKFHLAIHNEASSKYVCDMCGKSFIQPSAFKRHSLIHGSELAFKCTLCPYRGRHPGLLKTHMQTHTRDYQHRCMECPARFLTKSNLNKHLQRHKGPVDFKCDTCKRGFYSKLELDRHFEADHLGVKNHVCNICGKAFGYRNAMMSHQLKVHKRAKLTNGKGRLPLYLEEERNK